MKNRYIFSLIFLAIVSSCLIEAQRGRMGQMGSFGPGGAGKMGGGPPQMSGAGRMGQMGSFSPTGGPRGLSLSAPKQSPSNIGRESFGGFESSNVRQAPAITQDRSFGGDAFDMPGSKGGRFEGAEKFDKFDQAGPQLTPKRDTPAAGEFDFGQEAFKPDLAQKEPLEGKLEAPDIGKKPQDLGPDFEGQPKSDSQLPKETETKPVDLTPKRDQTGPETGLTEKPADVTQGPKIEPAQVEKLGEKFDQPQVKEKTLENIAQKTGKDLDQIKKDMQNADQKLDPTKVHAKGKQFEKFTNKERLNKQKDVFNRNFKGRPWKWWWKHNRSSFFTLFPVYFYSLYGYYPPIYYDYYSSYGYYPTAVTYLAPLISGSGHPICMRKCTQGCLNTTNYDLNTCLNECSNRCR